MASSRTKREHSLARGACIASKSARPIPHPTTANSLTWYFLTGRKPNTIKDDLTPTTGSPPISAADKKKARNVVKTVEIEYGQEIDTGETLPGGGPKKKVPHLILVYAGGNGT